MQISFKGKFPRFSKIPILNSIGERIYDNGVWHSLFVVAVCSLFLLFGLYHLGEFITVDEESFWLGKGSVFYNAVKDGAWGKTYLIDKPGVTIALLSGLADFFMNPSQYYHSPRFSYYLFWWRFPIALFNFFLLFLIYHFLKKLLNKDCAAIILTLIALNPVLIGISQIVNPDATLWSTAFLAFLTFLLYVKNSAKKYIVYSGIFFGLALLTKFPAIIYYPLFFIILHLEYLFNTIDKKLFIKKFFGLSGIYVISVFVYLIFLPACWINIKLLVILLLRGSVSSLVLCPEKYIFWPLTVFAFLELLLFKGRLTEFARTKFNLDTVAILIEGGLVVLAFFGFILFNFFLLPHEVELWHEGGKYDIFRVLPASLVTMFLTMTVPLSLGLLLSSIVVFFKKCREEIGKATLSVLIYSFLLIFSFIIGASILGFRAEPRYQIILFPVYALISGIIFAKVFDKKAIVVSAVLVLSLFAVVRSIPFYLCYANILNIKNYVIFHGWGMGGFEMAQYLNSLPNAEKIKIWTDQEGVKPFFLGKTYFRRPDPFTIKNLDYLVLSYWGYDRVKEYLKYGGKRGLKYIELDKESVAKILKYYETNNPEYSAYINGNPRNFVKLVKFDGEDRIN